MRTLEVVLAVMLVLMGWTATAVWLAGGCC